MDYTNRLQKQIYDWTDDYCDITESDILEFLNDEASFRNFGESLSDFISSVIDTSKSTPEEILKKRAEQEGLYLNRNTVNNWFSGKRPKKGDQSREHMYKIAFALDLNVDDTVRLFQKVYLDKPFNMRSIREFIYYYCLKNHLTYKHAEHLIALAENNVDDTAESTVMTRIMTAAADDALNDAAVLAYIHDHPHNFQLSNRSSRSIMEELLRQILPSEEDAALLKSGNALEGNVHSYIAKELAHFGNEILQEYRNKSFTSISTMIDIIMGIDMVRTRAESSESLIKNATLLSAIKNRFPSQHSFSLEEPSFEEIRKVIILLFSYKCWYEKQYNDVSQSLVEYTEEMNALLFDASLQTLYPGNPYDWMFMFCTMSKFPLDIFRDIMAGALLAE